MPAYFSGRDAPAGSGFEQVALGNGESPARLDLFGDVSEVCFEKDFGLLCCQRIRRLTLLRAGLVQSFRLSRAHSRNATGQAGLVNRSRQEGKEKLPFVVIPHGHQFSS
jgi:hypothetical protein